MVLDVLWLPSGRMKLFHVGLQAPGTEGAVYRDPAPHAQQSTRTARTRVPTRQSVGGTQTQEAGRPREGTSRLEHAQCAWGPEELGVGLALRV